MENFAEIQNGRQISAVYELLFFRSSPFFRAQNLGQRVRALSLLGWI